MLIMLWEPNGVINADVIWEIIELHQNADEKELPCTPRQHLIIE